jgi:hypothetical protein
MLPVTGDFGVFIIHCDCEGEEILIRSNLFLGRKSVKAVTSWRAESDESGRQSFCPKGDV